MESNMARRTDPVPDSRRPSRLRRIRRSLGERGQAAAELGMMLPLILILMIGVIEVNNVLSNYISVVTSARDGARIGSKGGATTGEIQALVVRDLEQLPGTTPTGNVTVTYPNIGGQDAVRVRACYDHDTLLQVPLLLPSTFQMCSETTMSRLQ